MALTVGASADIVKAAESLTAADVVKRIAGIYALESLARSGSGSRKAVVNILSAFVRERSSRQDQNEDWQELSREASNSDIELALRSLSKLNSQALRIRIDLRGAQLASADLSNLNLARADLSGAVLNGSDLSFSNLAQVSLRSTSLVGSRLDGANLTDAVLDDTDLTKASLVSTNLTGALIRSAKMRGVYAISTNFSGALLGEVDLTGAHLRDVEIKFSGDDTEDSQPRISRPHVAELQADGPGSDLPGEKF
ncbi:MAG: pentapeptide repeat-containing protein [Pseudonocardiaceae bacterium]